MLHSTRSQSASGLFSANQILSALHLILLLIFFTTPHFSLSPPSPSNITDLIVNVGENVLLECTSEEHLSLNKSTNFLSPSKSSKPAFRFIWCRYEEDWATGQTTTVKKEFKLPVNGNNGDDSNLRPNCFEGDRLFVASESSVSTVVYCCRTISSANDQIVATHFWKLYVDAFERVLAKRETMSTSSIPFSQEPVVQQIEKSSSSNDYFSSSRSYSPPNRLSASSIRCPPPRCKPYASVVSAACSRIELTIRYPTTQYGYNRSADHWGTINCGGENDEENYYQSGQRFNFRHSEHSPPPITGYQLWLIGYGIVKKFKPDEAIVMDNLVPGKRYCFNGWAVNRCGSGPVFTLEGVCAANTEDCRSSSDEHCELDVDYSY